MIRRFVNRNLLDKWDWGVGIADFYSAVDRFVIRPIVDYVLDLEKKNPQRQIAVLIPELVERRWYLNLLHNHRSAALKALLLFQGDQRITVINIPWYLSG